MLKLTLCFVLTLYGAALGQEKRVDVCGVSKTLYDNGGRNVACGGSWQALQGLCDSERPEGWYKVVANSDADPVYNTVDMPTVCPEVGRCGAQHPLWLNGSLPSESEDVVKLTACMARESGCCEKTFPIYVKNCTSFISYYLERTPDCSSRYCFGNSQECPHRIPTPGVQETTRSYWETTTQPWRDRTTYRTTRRWWDMTTPPYWERSSQPWWDRTTRPYWERSTQPWWDRTTRPYWERSTQPWWDRTTRPYWERSTRPWWDRTTRPYWERSTRPWWYMTTRPWWDRTTGPWWYSTTYEPRPEDAWERRYRHLLHMSRRNTILSGITLLLLAVTIVSVAAMALCKCRKRRRRQNYAMFQPATITGSFKA